jgi:hypothetical protein
MGVVDEVTAVFNEEEFTEVAAMFAWMCKELQNNPIKQAAYLVATLANIKVDGLNPAVDCAVSLYGKVIPFEK